jgi:Bacterial regulatory protein, Fis family
MRRRKLLILGQDSVLRPQLERIFVHLNVTLGAVTEQALGLVRRIEPDVVTEQGARELTVAGHRSRCDRFLSQAPSMQASLPWWCGGTVFPDEIGEMPASLQALRVARQGAEIQAVRQALAVTKGNLSRAAEMLGMTRRRSTICSKNTELTRACSPSRRWRRRQRLDPSLPRRPKATSS